MCHKKFSNTLSHDVSNWLILTAALLKVKRHQDIDIVLQALWLVNDNLSDGGKEHILLLILRALNKFENFLQEEFGVANGDTSQSNGCSLSNLIILMVEQRRNQLYNIVHL
jgi:hypothetical protein